MHRSNTQIEIHHFSLYISFLHVHGSCLAYIHKCAQMPHASYHNSAQVGLFLLCAWRMYVPVCSTCTFEWYAHVWWLHVCIRHDLHLAYGWHPWNFIRPIRIQHAGKTSLSCPIRALAGDCRDFQLIYTSFWFPSRRGIHLKSQSSYPLPWHSCRQQTKFPRLNIRDSHFSWACFSKVPWTFRALTSQLSNCYTLVLKSWSLNMCLR